MKRLLLWGVHRPLQAGTLLVLLTVFFAFWLPRLEIDASHEGLMLERDPARQYYDQVKKTFGSDSLTIVVLKAEDVFAHDVLAAIVRLTRSVERLDGVTRVDSLATVENFSADADGLRTAPLIDGEPPRDPGELSRIREEALGNPLFVSNLVSRDGRAAGISIYTEADEKDREFNKRFSDRVDALLAAESTPGLTLYQVGAPLTKASVVDFIRRDQQTLVPLSALTLFIVLILAFRTPSGVVAPLVTGLVSVVWGLGLMAMFRIPLNVITAAVPSLVLVIGFAEDVHIITEYHRLLRERGDKLRALAAAVEETALPILVTTATTILAFATLITTDITMLIQFGYASTLALAANFVVTLLGIPVMLRLWPVPKRFRVSAFAAGDTGDAIASAAGRAGDFVLRHRIPVVTIFALVAVASLVGISRLRVDTDFINYLPENSSIRQRMRDVHTTLAGASVFSIVVDSGRENGIVDPVLIRKIADLQRFLERLPGIDKTVSIADYMARLHSEMTGERSSTRSVPSSPEMVSQYLLLIDRPQIEQFVDLPASSASILVRHNLSGSWELSSVLRRLDAYIAEHFPGVHVRYTGEAVLTNRAADAMALNELTSVMYTLVIIGLIHSALFMSLKAGLLSLVPNVVPVIYTFGLMGLLGVPLSTGTAMVATIAIGIAVDDTVHNMVTYSRQLNEHHDQRIAALQTMRLQSRPMIYISLALAAGFSMLAFSRFVPTVHVGLFSAFVMIVALLAELVLTPILMSSTQLVTLWNMVLLKMNPELVRTAPLFQGLSRWEARKVVLLGILRSLGPGEYVIRKGEQGRDLFMVVTGHVVVNDFEADGTERTLAHVGPGGVFGEMGLVGDGYRTTSVRAETESEVLRLDFDAFERLRKRFPFTAAKVFRNLARILSERLQDTTTALLYISGSQRAVIDTRQP